MKAAVKNTNIIKPQESAFKNIIAFNVFTVYPPCEIDKQFLKNFFKKLDITFTGLFLFNVIYLQCSPCLYRRIYIAEIPFICRQLAIRFHVPFAHNKQ